MLVFIIALITINPATGAGSFFADLNFGAATPDIRGLAFSFTDVLFALSNMGPAANPDDLYTINVATGVGTLIGPTGFSGLQSIAFSPAGVLYGWDPLPCSRRVRGSFCWTSGQMILKSISIKVQGCK